MPRYDCSSHHGPHPSVQVHHRQPTDWCVHELCNGPAKLCQSMQIDFRTHDGCCLLDGGELQLVSGEAEVDPEDVVISARVGIDYAGAWKDTPLRFSIDRSIFVSAPRPKVTSALGTDTSHERLPVNPQAAEFMEGHTCRRVKRLKPSID